MSYLYVDELRKSYDQSKVKLFLKTLIFLVKAEETGVLLPHGCHKGASSLRQEHYAKLRTIHPPGLASRHRGTQRKSADYHCIMYRNRAIQTRTRDSVDTTVRSRRGVTTGTLIRVRSERRVDTKANRVGEY